MMLIITDKIPLKSSNYLVENTSKSFVFKSLLELGQLICSTGISNVYKPVKQGKELQKWILNNKLWTYRYYSLLWFWCIRNTNAKMKTLLDLYKIRDDLYESVECKYRIRYPKTAIFRYKKGYVSKYKTNSELPLDVCCEEYKKYLEWKFEKVGE